MDDDSDETVAAVDRWFRERRLTRLLADQERKAKVAAAAERSLKKDEADLIVERLIKPITPLVPELSAGVPSPLFLL
jgi:hypothetical protein